MPEDPRPAEAPDDGRHADASWRRWVRGALIGVLALVLALAAVLAILHTPPAQAFVLDRLAAFARSRLGIELRAERLAYNLFSLTVRADGLLIDIPGGTETLVTIGHLEVDLTPAALRGRLAADRLAASDVGITIRPGPGDSTPASPTIPAFDVGSVTIDGLNLLYSDPDGFGTLAVRDVTLEAVGGRPRYLAGHLAAKRGLSLATPAAVVVSDVIEAQLTLDGDALSVEPLNIRLHEGEIAVRGRATVAASGIALDLGFAGRSALAEVAAWVPAIAPAAGAVQISGRVFGPVGTPSVVFEADGDAAALPWFRVARWNGSGTLDATGLQLARLEVATGAGDLLAAGRLAFGREQSAVDASWRDVALDRLPRWLAGVDATLPRLEVSGSGRFEWPGTVPTLDRVSGTARADVRGAAGQPPTKGTLVASGAAGAWTLDLDQQLTDSTEARASVSTRLAVDDLGNSPLQGTASVRSRDIEATLRDLADLGLPVPADVTGLTTGESAIDVRLGGTPASPTLVAEVDAQAVSIGGGRPLHLVGTVELDRQFVHLGPLAATGPLGNTLEARGSIGLGTTPGKGTFTFRINELGRLAAAVPERWRPTGHLDVDGSWTGTLDTLAAAVSLSSDAIDLAGTPFASLEGTLDISRERLTVRTLSLRQDSTGTVDLAGGFEFDTRDLAITARARGLDLVAGRTPPDDAGRVTARGVSFDANVSGPWSGPTGRVNASADAVAWRDDDLGPLSTVATSDGVTARIDVDLPQLAAALDGSVQLAEPWAYAAQAGMREASLPALFRALGIEDQVGNASGAVTVTTHARGALSSPADSALDVTLESLDGEIRRWPLLLAAPSRWQIEQRVLTTNGLDLVWGPAHLTVEAQEAPPPSGLSLRGTVRGSLEDVQALLEAPDPETWHVRGAVEAVFEASGSLEAPQVEGRVTVAEGGVIRGKQPLASGIGATVEARDGVVELRALEASVLNGTVTGSGRAPVAWLPAPLGAWLADAQAREERGVLDLRASIPVAGALNWLTGGTRAKVEGGLDADLHLDAASPTLDALSGELVLGRASLVSGDLSVAQGEPARLSLANGRIEVHNLQMKGPRSELAAEGFVSLVPERESNLRVYGAGTLRLFDLFLPGLASGRAGFEVQVRGAAASRRVAAVIDLDNASLVLPDKRLVFADWTGRLTLNRFGLEANSLTGQINGGDITVAGFLPIGTDIAPPDPLSVKAQAVLLEMPKGLRTETDADLSWRRDGEGSTVVGTVTIHAGSYREPVTQMIALVQTLTSGPADEGTLPAWLDAMRLDVKVTATEPLRLNNSLADAEFLPDLRLVGTVGEPALQGELVALENGRLSLGGRSYRMLESEISFSPATGVTPTLNIQAETRVSDYEVYLRLTGPPEAVETSLSSNPPLGERDLRSLLLTGRTTGVSGEAVGGDAFAMGAVSADVLGLAGSFVGVDTVSFGQTTDLDLVASDVDPATRFTVTKSFGRQFEVILSQNLDENELTWVVVYRPGVNYQFRLSSRDNQEESIEFRQEVAFGPGVGTHRRAPSARQRSDAVISAVDITGEATVDTKELRSLLALDPGDRFDFAKWQRDQARLEDYYRERGHLAVRVVPRRRAVDDEGKAPRVALEYRVEPGPRTLIEVVGYNLPKRARQAVADARADAVFASFFTGQVEEVVRNHLVDEGYLRAHVEATVVEQTDDLERVVVTITPGPRTVEREIALNGNSIDSEVLLAFAEQRGVVGLAWRSPEPLIEALRTAYAGQGFLRAELTAQPIVFAGDSATLPIDIVEGPQAHVGRVSFDGLDAMAEDAALAAAGLAGGDVYGAGAERSAGIRLRNGLRNLGYADARVTPQAEVGRDGRDVALRFEVRQGPRQVVRTVRIEGIESTNPGLVERAVAVKPGEPARPSDVSRTQRQLYERGVFRKADVEFEPVTPQPPAARDEVSVDAIVSVEEFKKYLLRYGVSLSNKNSTSFKDLKALIGVAADVRDRNFLGRGLSVGIGGRWEQDLWSVRSLFTAPRLGRVPVISNVYFTVREEVDAGEGVDLTTDETNLHLEQRWRPFGGAELTWGYLLDWTTARYDLVTSQESIPVLEAKGRLAGLSLTGVVDRRDSPFDATRGWLHSSSLQWGLQPLGSDFGYVRYLLRQFGYQPVGPVVLAGGVRWGGLWGAPTLPPVVDPFAYLNDLVVVDLYYQAGGSQTVRGYEEDSLSAVQVAAGRDTYVQVGGPDLLVFNGEVRFPIYKWFKGVFFADAGNTFLSQQDISFDALAVGAGFGLRINTPLAPIRLDLAYPLDRRPGDKRYRIHFSIGQMF